MIKYALSVLLFMLFTQSISAETYISKKNHFSIEFNKNWVITDTPDKSVDIMLSCRVGSCGKTTNLAFSAFYNYQLRKGKLYKFLKHANGNIITTKIKNSPYIKNFNLLREGRTKIGDIDAYEVIMSYEYLDNQKRIRHTYMTFDSGYIYNISFHSAPKKYDKDFQIAKTILATFRFTR